LSVGDRRSHAQRASDGPERLTPAPRPKQYFCATPTAQRLRGIGSGRCVSRGERSSHHEGSRRGRTGSTPRRRSLSSARHRGRRRQPAPRRRRSPLRSRRGKPRTFPSTRASFLCRFKSQDFADIRPELRVVELIVRVEQLAGCLQAGVHPFVDPANCFDVLLGHRVQYLAGGKLALSMPGTSASAPGPHLWFARRAAGGRCVPHSGISGASAETPRASLEGSCH
jgi:hypothetical protein